MNRRELEDIIKKLLGIEFELDGSTSLIKYGGDSLFFGRLQIELKRMFGLKVPIQQLFQNSTIEQLCKVLGIEETGGEKINITDLQTSYLYGRKPEMILGGKGSRAYFSFEVEEVDIDRLQRAIKRLVEEQEVLRSTFHEDKYANVLEIPEIDFTYYDFQMLSGEEKEEKLEEVRKDLFERDFNTEKGPLICFVATRLDDKKTIVHICHDGLVADGESHQIILRELENLYYERQNAGHCSFSEYSQYIKGLKENQDYSKLLTEKVKMLVDFDTKPQLNTLRDAKKIVEPDVGVVSRIIPENLYFNICENGRKNAVTPFSVLLTAFGKALAKYSDNSKFLLNLPVSYRPMELDGIENLVGLCSNFILFGFDDSRSIGFWEQVEDNQNKLFSSREEGMLLSGIDVLKKVKQTKKEEIIAPVVFTSTVGGARRKEAKFRKNMTLSYTSQVWLEGLLTEVPEGVLFTLSYIKELFDEDMVNGIADIFTTVLTMFGNEDRGLFKMTDIPLAARDSEVIKKLNDTTEIRSYTSFRENLKKNCEIYAEKYVFIDEQSYMTYRELGEFFDKLNFILLKKYSLKSGDKVGLYLPKGVIQAACEVALAYLNIVFLPIDFEFPVKIVEHCVSTVGLRMILTDTKEHMEDIAAVTTTIINLENEMPRAGIEKAVLEENLETMLINTSGTTGLPKTVILTWRGIMNCINSTQKLFDITSKDIAFGVTNYGHDMSIFDVLGMAYVGGTTVMPNQHNYKNPEIWVDMMNKHKVTVWVSVPALLEMLLYSDLEKLPEVVGKLYRVVQGGDYLHVDTVKEFRKWNQKGKIFNVGGPTETTMWNIYHEVSEEDIQNNNIPYGKPFPNTQYYILDKKHELCPVGKEGQMYIAGDGVTPGYVGIEEQGKFTEYKGLKVYCSGDYGMYVRKGEILFRGRKDRQIKINGKRIELDGIEEKLNTINDITKGAVIYKDKRIVAYYVAKDKSEVTNIKEILSGTLPEYMIPAVFYEIKKLPYNRSNKVDYRELERIIPETEEQEVAETELEDLVTGICENIFEVDRIGVKESFYNLGGDSVTAMRIAAVIKKEFGVHMTPYDIFEHSTIRDLAAYIAKLRSEVDEKG